MWDMITSAAHMVLIATSKVCQTESGGTGFSEECMVAEGKWSNMQDLKHRLDCPVKS